jgi:hypothetical protein
VCTPSDTPECGGSFGAAPPADMECQGCIVGWQGATCDGRADGWGDTLLLVGSIAAVLYCGLGIAYNAKQHGLRGARAIPHLRQWKELRSLVIDGCAFAAARGKSSRRSGTSMASSPEKSLRDGSFAPAAARKHKKQAKQHGTKSRKHGKNGRHQSRSACREPLVSGEETQSQSSASSPRSPSPDVAHEWQPTRSSSFLAAGARETGVKVNI